MKNIFSPTVSLSTNAAGPAVNFQISSIFNLLFKYVDESYNTDTISSTHSVYADLFAHLR